MGAIKRKEIRTIERQRLCVCLFQIKNNIYLQYLCNHRPEHGVWIASRCTHIYLLRARVVEACKLTGGKEVEMHVDYLLSSLRPLMSLMRGPFTGALSYREKNPKRRCLNHLSARSTPTTTTTSFLSFILLHTHTHTYTLYLLSLIHI